MLLWLAFFALFLLCAGISVIFIVYICIIWYASFVSQRPPTNSNPPPAQYKTAKKGLSPTELEMLPGVLKDGGRIAKGVECAVCLDDIEQGQPARVMSECGHVFHRRCANVWLSTNATCPICRIRLLPPAVVAPAVPPPPPSEVDAV